MRLEAGLRRAMVGVRGSGLGGLGCLPQQPRRAGWIRGRRHRRARAVRPECRPHEPQGARGRQRVHQIHDAGDRVQGIALRLRQGLLAALPAGLCPGCGLPVRGGRELERRRQRLARVREPVPGIYGGVRLPLLLHAEALHPCKQLRGVELWWQVERHHRPRFRPRRHLRRQPRHIPARDRRRRLRQQRAGVAGVRLAAHTPRRPVRLPL
mmetsp:Transcript_125872/g.364205  ORF Transcript_125872/g.364205 Transcript_125872/m.364205 type:complete len:210 (+) Transcript_125872:1094-1723(+)